MTTLAEALDAYDTNADYAEVGSASKCAAFITACRRLLSPGVSPKRNVHGGRGAEEIELDLTVIQEQLRDAQRWLQANPSASAGGAASAVTHVDFTGFRD